MAHTRHQTILDQAACVRHTWWWTEAKLAIVFTNPSPWSIWIVLMLWCLESFQRPKLNALHISSSLCQNIVGNEISASGVSPKWVKSGRHKRNTPWTRDVKNKNYNFFFLHISFSYAYILGEPIF